MRLTDVARVELAPDERRGLTEMNGEGEVVERHRRPALQPERAFDVIAGVKRASRRCRRACRKACASRRFTTARN